MPPKRKQFSDKLPDWYSTPDDQLTIAQRVAKQRRPQFDTGRYLPNSSAQPLALSTESHLASTSDQKEGTTKPEFERKIESANALIDRVTKYLNDHDVDLLFMEGKRYFANFNEQFEKFKNSVSEDQHNTNHLAESQKQLETLFKGVNTLKEYKGVATKATYKADDYQSFIDENGDDLEKYPLYHTILSHFENFEEHIAQAEEDLTSLLNSHEVNSEELSQKWQNLSDEQDQLDNVFQGAQEIKNFSEVLTKAHDKQREIQPYITTEGNKRFVVYSQLYDHFQNFQECLTQGEQYLSSNDLNIRDLPQKYQYQTKSQSQLETCHQELLRNYFEEAQLQHTVKAAEEQRDSISQKLDLYKDDISWLERSGHLANFYRYFQTFKASISKAQEYLESNQLDSDGLSQRDKDLTESQSKLDKDLKVIELKIAVTDAKKKLNGFDQHKFEQECKILDMDIYGKICLENLQEGISKSQRYLESSQVNHDETSKNFKDLAESQRELDKAVNVMEFRKKHPTAEAVLDEYLPQVPEKAESDREGRIKVYWKKLIEKREDRKLTNAEFNDLLPGILKERSEHIARLAEGSHHCMRIKLGRLKEGLRRGRLLSAFDEEQIGMSYSTDSHQLSSRKQKNRALFGLCEPAELCPLFGYLTPHENGSHRLKKLKQYGGIIIRLKKDKRTTITLYDSSECTNGEDILMCRPVPCDKINVDCFPLRPERLDLEKNVSNLQKFILDPCTCNSIEDFRPYAETQHLGGVPKDLIDHIYFTSPRHLDDELKSLLEKRDIPYSMPEPHEYELNMDWVNEHIAVGGSIHPEEIKALGPQGIMHVVDTRAEHCDDKDTLTSENIDWLHLPTEDNHPLSIKQLMEGTAWVNEHIKKGERVLIHCEHGIGRSVLLTCAVLVTRGFKASEALKLVKQQREQAALNPLQLARLLEFEAVYHAG